MRGGLHQYPENKTIFIILKGAVANEYDNKSNGKSAAGTVPFYQTPRFHHISRYRAFQSRLEGNSRRQNRPADSE